MGNDQLAPPALRRLIAADLRPVRPLLQPWQRALALIPLALLACVAVPLLLFSLRGDQARLGISLSWGASLLQMAVAILVATAAYREVIPGRSVGARRHVLLVGLGLALALSFTLLTSHASPRSVPPGKAFAWAKGCFRLSFRDGLPVLLVMIALAARGYLARPALAGALAGTAVGLMTDSGWRLVCGVSDPGHVLAGHLAVVPAMAVVGAAITWVVARLARPAA